MDTSSEAEFSERYDFFNLMGLTLYINGQSKEAILAFDRAIHLNPKKALLIITKGMRFLTLNFTRRRLSPITEPFIITKLFI